MFKIISSNIKKRKSSMVILFVLVLLATLLLSIGITILSQLGSFFDQKTENLNAPDVSYFVNTQNTNKLIEKLSDFKGIDKTESEDAIYISGIEIKSDTESFATDTVFLNADNSRKMAPLKFLEKGNLPEKNVVVLPFMYKGTYGIHVGDKLKMVINGNEQSFTVYGFFEDVIFGSPLMGTSKIYLFNKDFTQLSSKSTVGKLFSVQTNEKGRIDKIAQHVISTIADWEKPVSSLGLSITEAKENSVLFVSMIGMIIFAFSFIVVLIALIVISFSIKTDVEDGIKEIGILKAIGYKNKQIMQSILLQYVGISSIAGVIGIALSALVLPNLGGVISSSAGLAWKPSASMLGLLFSIGLIIFLTSVVVWRNAKKATKITPIYAIRGGLDTHNFKKNHFPLAKSKLSVVLSIALKSIMGNKKQNGIILVIVTLLTFACVFASVFYYNMVANPKAIVSMVGIQDANVMLTAGITTSKAEKSKMFEEITKMDGVDKTVESEMLFINVEDLTMVGLSISSDFNNLGKGTIIEGRYPKYDNEMAISTIFAEKYDKKVGDTFELSLKGKTEGLLVTGITQQITMNGRILDITEAGYQRFDNNYSLSGLSIYLNKDVDTKEFIDQINKKYPNIEKSMQNVDEILSTQLTTFDSAVSAVMVLVVLITVTVISLILYLIIKIKILRERTNLGLFRSMGFTSYQLMSQISLSILSIIGISVVAGGVLGSLFANNLVKLLLTGMGISNSSFVINYNYVALIVVGITLLSFVMANLVALRIRKITPYNLLVE